MPFSNDVVVGNQKSQDAKHNNAQQVWVYLKPSLDLVALRRSVTDAAQGAIPAAAPANPLLDLYYKREAAYLVRRILDRTGKLLKLPGTRDALPSRFHTSNIFNDHTYRFSCLDSLEDCQQAVRYFKKMQLWADNMGQACEQMQESQNVIQYLVPTGAGNIADVTIEDTTTCERSDASEETDQYFDILKQQFGELSSQADGLREHYQYLADLQA